MKRSPLTRIVFGAVLLVVPAAADAPADQYDAFKREDATVRDHWTTLTWIRGVDRTQYPTEGSAEAYCKSLGAVVPTVKELLTIVDEEPHQEYEGRQIVSKMIDAYAFPSTPVEQVYWTSTPAGANAYWTVSFATGVTAPLTQGGAGVFVRCVK